MKNVNIVQTSVTPLLILFSARQAISFDRSRDLETRRELGREMLMRTRVAQPWNAIPIFQCTVFGRYCVLSCKCWDGYLTFIIHQLIVNTILRCAGCAATNALVLWIFSCLERFPFFPPSQTKRLTLIVVVVREFFVNLIMWLLMKWLFFMVDKSYMGFFCLGTS